MIKKKLVSPYNTDAEPGALRASRRLLILRNRFTALLVPTSSIPANIFHTRLIPIICGWFIRPRKNREYTQIYHPIQKYIHPSLSFHTKNKKIKNKIYNSLTSFFVNPQSSTPSYTRIQGSNCLLLLW